MGRRGLTRRGDDQAGGLSRVRQPLVVTLTLIGCVGCTSPSTRSADAPFVLHQDDGLASARATFRLLVPSGNCILGIAEETGYRVSNWVGEQGCTRLVPSPGPGLVVTSTVPMDDGSIIGVGESLFRRDPDGSVSALAALPPQVRQYADSPPTPFGLARSGRRLIMVGRFRAYDKQWGEVYLPTAWESTDGGVTVHQITLPLPPIQHPLHIQEALGLGPSVLPMHIAADGDTVLTTDGFGFGSAAGLRLWRSVDGGHTWSVVSVPVDRTQAASGVFTLLRAAGRWLLIFQNEPYRLGRTAQALEPNRLVFGSVDGSEWKVETGLELGSGSVVAATRDRGDNLVLTGYDHEPLPAGCENSSSSQRYRCLPTWREVVWTGPIGNMVRRNLECAISAGTPTAVATLADSRVLVVDTQGKLWIRG